MSIALTLKPAKILTTTEINGKPVSFFTPPHAEPDFPWVDVQELAAAFCSREETILLTNASQLYGQGGTRAIATAISGDRIVTIVCHAHAQGLSGAIDHMTGIDDDGPAVNAYCFAAAEVAQKHWPLGLEELFRAFHNVGGPFTRSH